MIRSDWKGKDVNPLIPTLVIDDFFETPHLWRSFALQQEFFKGDRGTWPGIRTKYIEELHPELYEVFKHKLLSYLPAIPDFSRIEATFQAIGGEWGNGWVHDDNPVHDVAGVVFLHPDPPAGSGNTVYQNSEDFNSHRYTEIFNEDMRTETDHDKFAKYRDEQRSMYIPAVRAENRFNRCVVFDPRQWHSADNFFGDNSAEDSRLTLVFFCNR